MNEKTLVQTIEKPHFRFFLSQRKILPTRVLEFPADCATVNRGKSIGHRFLEENRSGRRIVGELNFQTSHGRACRPEWNEFSRPHRDREWEKRGRKLEWIDNGFRLSLCGRHERGREFLVASTIAPTYRRHLVMFNLSAIRQPVDVWFDGLSRGTRSSATINVNIGRDFLEIEEWYSYEGRIGSLVPWNRAALRGISALRSGDMISWKVALRRWILRSKRLCNVCRDGDFIPFSSSLLLRKKIMKRSITSILNGIQCGLFFLKVYFKRISLRSLFPREFSKRNFRSNILRIEFVQLFS